MTHTEKHCDDALVAPADRLESGRCSVEDSQKSFLAHLYASTTIDNCWATVSVHKSSIRFTINKKKVSLDYQSISRRNKMFWHTARDDTMFTAMRCISRHEDTQRSKLHKSKYVHKRKTDYDDTSLKQKPVQATKGTRLKTKAKVAKSDRKKQPAKMPNAKGLDVLSKVIELTLSQRVLGDNGKEDEDDENNSEDKSDGNDDDGNQEGDDTNDNDEETNKEEEEKIDDEETMDEEEDDEVTKELYDDQAPKSENPSPADNEIASLMETSTRHAMAIPEITSSFTITIPPPPPFFNPLPQQATPTLTPITSEATTLFPSLPDFSSVFRFNNRVTNLEKDLSEIKQVDSYAQALSSIRAIVDRYIDNKLREAINKAIQADNLDCRQEAQYERNAYIELVDTSMRAIIKEEKNVTELLEAAVLTRSSSHPKSTYEAVASLSKFELTKILLDKMEESKSHLGADYKKKLYDVLVESYNTDKDLFNTYGEVFTLKRSRDDNDKDRDPSDGSNRGTKKGNQAKKLKHPEIQEEPSHIVDDSGVQQDQEFDTGNNDEQPADKEVTKNDWFKKPERPPTPDSDWNKRQLVDSRPPQT
ncbi:hypothetical protein Tco_0910044 [Tanacetum coccineum]|uniref:Uncharacterized protein n=1 Tax=Tanacetum coccineum TaxID=301880 RepID=A0ABQ5CYY2_9ASTR